MFDIFPLRYFVFRYFATSMFCVRYLPTTIFCVRYFAFDILHSIFCPSLFCVIDLLPFHILRYDILRFRYSVVSIFCDFDISLSIFCFRYFAIQYFAFRYFVQNPENSMQIMGLLSATRLIILITTPSIDQATELPWYISTYIIRR